jgi:drug/metabolite transporter (DMT)-like permease
MYLFISGLILSIVNALVIKRIKSDINNNLLLLCTECIKIIFVYVGMIHVCNKMPVLRPFRWKFIVNSLCYVITNSVSWWLLENMSASSFYTLTQHKILWVVLLSMYFLKKTYSSKKWFAILLILCGSIANRIEHITADSMRFVPIIVLMSIISSFSGVWMERMMKRPRKKSDDEDRLYYFLNDSLHMYILGIPMYMFNYYYTHQNEHTLGLTYSGLFCVSNALQGVCIGTLFMWYSSVWRPMQISLVIAILMVIEHVSSIANWLSIVFILSGLYLWSVPLHNTKKIKDNKKRKSRRVYIIACIAMLIFIAVMMYKHYNTPAKSVEPVEPNAHPTVQTRETPVHSQNLLRKPRRYPTFTDVLRSKKEMEYWNILSSNAGTYNGCTGPTLWVIMGGHLRSADLHVLNTKAFLEQSHTCTFIIYVLRRYVAEHSLSYAHKFADGSEEWKKWTSINTTARAEYLLDTLGTNAAYMVTERTKTRGPWVNWDTRYAGLVAIRELQKRHSISPNAKDIVVLTRPDIVFSHAIDIAKLIQVKERFQMYIPHSSGSAGTAQDPNDTSIVLLGFSVILPYYVLL